MPSIKQRIEKLESTSSKSGLTPAQWIQLAQSMQGGALIPGKIYPSMKKKHESKGVDTGRKAK
jgi:hypothetical protein